MIYLWLSLKSEFIIEIYFDAILTFFGGNNLLTQAFH